jgi:hypothetical protein
MKVNMENSNSISAFDILRQRLNLPDPWISTEQPALSKRQIASRRVSRIFRRMLVGVGLDSVATAVKRSDFGGVVDSTRNVFGR